MSSARVLVAGSTGMVGRVVVARLLAAGHEVVRAGRAASADLELDLAHLSPLVPVLAGFDVVVNAAGVLRGQLDYPGDAFRLAATSINAVWPLALAEAAAQTGTRVVHVSTDGVFGPADVPADESAPAVPQEPYGQSKLLGESAQEHVVNIRCSVIGPAPDRPPGLWERVVRAGQGEELPGYTDHLWSGTTSGQLAAVVTDLVAAGAFSGVRATGPVQHFVPNGALPKADVLRLLALQLRPDVAVRPVTGPAPLPRVLVSSTGALDAVFSGPRGWEAAVAHQGQSASSR